MENKLESYNTTQRVITNNGNINPVLADIPRRINNNQFSMQKRSFRFSLQALPAVWLILSSLQGFLLFTFSSPESCREVAVSLHTIISCLVSHLPPLSSTVAIFPWYRIVCRLSLTFLTTKQVGGDPRPDIQWTRQGRAQSLPDNVQIVSERGMSIHNLHPSHQGVYVCQATNKAGTITASAMLRVQVSNGGGGGGGVCVGGIIKCWPSVLCEFYLACPSSGWYSLVPVELWTGLQGHLSYSAGSDIIAIENFPALNFIGSGQDGMVRLILEEQKNYLCIATG